MTIAVLTLKKLGLISDTLVVLAPEGEFSPGALTLKVAKKQLYINAAKLLGLLAKVTWKSASESERGDIETILGTTPNIFIAPNLPPVTICDEYDQVIRPAKTPGQARLVFLSRFMRKKNFNWLLENIRGVKGDLSIDICGPLEDADYWAETRRIAETLPPNINIEAKGPVPHDRVSATLADYHFFVLPTLGENFGHVFIEALAAGCPLIISDRTPWRQLKERSIGWDLPLEDPTAWVDTLNACVAMNGPDYAKLSQNARDFAVAWLSDPGLEASNRDVLRFAVHGPK
jgi:glycosyltransferase involved in cell wall biosynthesis